MSLKCITVHSIFHPSSLEGRGVHPPLSVVYQTNQTNYQCIFKDWVTPIHRPFCAVRIPKKNCTDKPVPLSEHGATSPEKVKTTADFLAIWGASQGSGTPENGNRLNCNQVSRQCPISCSGYNALDPSCPGRTHTFKFQGAAFNLCMTSLTNHFDSVMNLLLNVHNYATPGLYRSPAHVVSPLVAPRLQPYQEKKIGQKPSSKHFDCFIERRTKSYKNLPVRPRKFLRCSHLGF